MESGAGRGRTHAPPLVCTQLQIQKEETDVARWVLLCYPAEEESFSFSPGNTPANERRPQISQGKATIVQNSNGHFVYKSSPNILFSSIKEYSSPCSLDLPVLLP